MRVRLLFASGFTAFLFGACGDDESSAPDASSPDAGLAEVGAFEASTESSTRGDSAPSDASADTSSPDGNVADAGLDGSASADAKAAGDADAAGDAGADADSGTDADSGADAGADAGTLTWLLDKNSGANTYGGGLNANNFVASGTFITANAGVEWFGSGNGNATGSFNGLSLKQNLGGVVENKPYTVSFYVSQPDPGQLGLDFANFTKLRIGGPNGAMVWTSTVTPTTEDVWIKWTGTYTPVAGDVGGPFYFEATFDLGAKHSIGIDGPITAMP